MFTSQGMPEMASRPPEAREEAWNRFSLGTSRRNPPSQYCDLGVRPPELRDNGVCCLSPQSVVLLQLSQLINTRAIQRHLSQKVRDSPLETLTSTVLPPCSPATLHRTLSPGCCVHPVRPSSAAFLRCTYKHTYFTADKYWIKE